MQRKSYVPGEVLEPTPSLQKPPKVHAKHIGGAAQRRAAAHLTGSLTIQKYNQDPFAKIQNLPSFEEFVEKPGLIFCKGKPMVLGDVLEPTPTLKESPKTTFRK